jgi:cysteinyl-tRNA synthetase
MSVTHLGPQFEIHGGGRDLAFPHHEAERIQSEGSTAIRPVVRHWVHTGMVHAGTEVMSKSLGNLVLVRDLLDRWSADTVRLALVRHPYRDDLTWTDDLAIGAAELVRRWTSAAADRAREDGADRGDAGAALPDLVASRREEALAALANDLDTPGAVQKLDSIAFVALGRGDEVTRQAAASTLHDLATRVLGMQLREPA